MLIPLQDFETFDENEIATGDTDIYTEISTSDSDSWTEISTTDSDSWTQERGC